MPAPFRAELIEGIVYVPSPTKPKHGGPHGKVMTWAGTYEARTPGTLAFDNTTQILGDESEPQPDVSLLIVGGQTKENEDGYLVGAPELVAEVASSSASIDLHAKKRDYERHGVQEYVAVVVRDGRLIWHVREGDQFVEMPPDADGIHRSRRFPGLWLDGAALLRGDMLRVLEMLHQGTATPEHAAFCKALAARRSTGNP